MKRIACIGFALAGVALGGCHRREPAAPPSPAAETVAALRARPASPFGAARATRFESIASGLRPAFAPSDRATAQVTFPARASGAVHLEDAATHLAVDVSLADARDVAAAATSGYLVYAGAHASGATLVHRPLPEGTEDFLAFEDRPATSEVAYRLALGASVKGLRLVANTLELLDAAGTPRLRVAPPYLVGADGVRTDAELAVVDCAVDRSPAAPWGRAPTAPGATTCTLRVRWAGGAVAYPAILDPRWTTTGNMVSARQDHVAIRLSSNKVLVAGGRTSASPTTGLTSAELFDPATATWSATGPMSGARWSATATQLNSSPNSTTSGKVLIAGGINGTASLNTAELYSVSAGTFIGAATMNAARHLHTATLMPNGNVLVAGGMNVATVLATAAIYNPSSGTGSWTAVSTNMASPRTSHTATLLASSNTNFNNKVLIVGGNSGGTSSLTSVQLFDTTTLSWSTTTALPSAREGQTATMLTSGNVLVTGGKSGTSTLNTTLVFTIPSSGTSATWPSAGTLTSVRASHTATLLAAGVLNQGSVLVAGGNNGTSTLNTAELWNGSTTWTATTSLVSPVQGQTATLLTSGAVLLAGGNSGAGTVNVGDVYDPSFALACTSNSQCATGFCVSGFCCDTACNTGCGACNLTGKVGTCSPITGGTVCRDSLGECDVAETCSGTSTACPSDGFKGNGTACTDDGNPCTTDLCNGSSATCQHAAGNNGTVCTDDGNPCTTDLCNGTSTVCQHAPGNAGASCRAAAGECDLPETCTGTSATCPADAKKASGTACTDDGNVCTTDTCDGTNVTCQHAAGNAGTICRAAAGECDAAETCTGTSTTCPADAKKASGTTCTDDGNVCTTDTCDGANVTCQHPAGNAGTVCRTAAGECDLAETCSGTSTTCPTDAKKPSGTACTDDGNACTTDTCDGSAVVCQHAAGNAGTVCRPATGACDLAEACTGTSTACPPDGFQPNGTSCNDNNACTQTDTCQNGLCNGGNPVVCAADQCHTAGTCDQTTGYCTNPRVADGTACDDGNRCSVGDSCHAGTCMPGPATACTGAGQINYISVIDLGSTQGWSYANDINNNGEVAGADGLMSDGIYQLGIPGSRAFRWSATDGLVYLPWPGTQSYASAVNDAGVFSMTAGMTSGVMLPCRYDPAVDSQPQCQPGAGNGGGINAGGTMTGGGYYNDGTGVYRLRMFRINTGAVQVLPSLPDPNPTYMQAAGGAIDINGTVFGAQLRSDGYWQAIRYSDARGTESLNSLLPAGSDWDLHSAGHASPTQVVGWGTHEGFGRAYRMKLAADGSFVGITDLGIPGTFASDAPNVVEANGFNTSGEIAGTVYDTLPFWPQRAFVYTDGAGAIDLNTLIDPQSQWVLLAASAINDNHEVVGYGTYNGLYRAYKLTLPELTCTPVDSCHTATRDPVTGACTSQVKPDGAACDDGNACTQGDICAAGVCQGSTAFVCAQPDSCHAAGTCNPGTATPQPPSTQGLIGWWKLDGDGHDSSGGGHDLVVEGNVTPAPGRTGLGMKFDSASCMTTPAWNDALMTGASGVTLMAWVKPADGFVCPSGQTPLAVMGKGWDYSLGAWCYPTPGDATTGGVWTASAFGYPGGWPGGNPGQWTHVAFTWDHNQEVIYLNGQAVISYPNAGDFGNTESTFAIGCRTAGNQRLMNYAGTIDDAMLYRRVLSPAELAAYYAAANPCFYPNKPDGTTCEDGNQCTQNDTCAAGVCVGGGAVTCPPPDQCHTAAACVPATGCAALPAKPDGTACNDNNACTRVDLCEAGVCIGANPVSCVAPDACHTATCDPGTGACTITAGAGTCDIGAFDYDKAGRLIRDRSAQLTYDAYDQLLQVTPVAAPPAIANLPVEELAVTGSTQTIPGRPNQKAHVAVGATLASGISHAVLFEGEAPPLDINVAAGVSTNLYPSSVNGVDTVAGTIGELDGSYHAFRYDQSGLHDLGNPGDSTFSYDINDANQQVGFTTTGGLASGYRYADGVGFQPIGTLGGAQSWAWNIDDLGAVVASAQISGPAGMGLAAFGHAALYQDLVGLQDLNTLIDPALGVTLVIANDHRGDWVVGTDLAGTAQHGYRLRLSTGAFDEPTWPGSTVGTAVNAAGDAVGWGYTDTGNSQQAAWLLSDRTGFVNLNSLIDPASGWNLELAEGIDDLGDVVGWGHHNGVVSAFRLRIPLHSSGTGGPTVVEVHTYGFDGLRTSTTTAPGTSTAKSQFWIMQDYTQHDGIREHYLRVGDRLVARLTTTPPPTGGAGVLRDQPEPDSARRGGYDIAVGALLLFAALLSGAIAKRRRRWEPAIAAVAMLLLGGASCGVFGSDRQISALNWKVVTSLTHYLHEGTAAGPVLITDSIGGLVEERRYEPFGQPIGAINVLAEPQNALGKLTDPNTGWSYHGARWLQPQTARWTAPDPAVKVSAPSLLSSPWDLNPYQYVGQSPTTFWDPSGGFKLWIHEQITREALSGFSRDFVDTAVKGNRYQDNFQSRADFHFDSNHFSQGFSWVEKQLGYYESSGSRYDRAWAFGAASHGVQDFYAHSSFINYFHNFAPTAKSAPSFAEVYDPRNPHYGENADFRNYLRNRPLFSGHFENNIHAFKSSPGWHFAPYMAKDEPDKNDRNATALFDLARSAARKSTVEAAAGMDPFAGRENATFAPADSDQSGQYTHMVHDMKEPVTPQQ